MNPFYIAAVACWLWPLALCHAHVGQLPSNIDFQRRHSHFGGTK